MFSQRAAPWNLGWALEPAIGGFATRFYLCTHSSRVLWYFITTWYGIRFELTALAQVAFHLLGMSGSTSNYPQNTRNHYMLTASFTTLSGKAQTADLPWDLWGLVMPLVSKAHSHLDLIQLTCPSLSLFLYKSREPGMEQWQCFPKSGLLPT